MARMCGQCGKKPDVGHIVSHSNIKTLHRRNPNLVKKRIFDEAAGKLMARKLCTACLRSLVKIRV